MRSIEYFIKPQQYIMFVRKKFANEHKLSIKLT